MKTRQRFLSRFLVVTVLLSLLVVIGGCTSAAEPPGPLEVVGRLLDLRMERSVDTSAYAEVVSDPNVAAILVANAEAERDATTTPTPEWETPYLAREEDDSAQVVVVWRQDDAHSDWPAATLFLVERIDGDWFVTDAETIANLEDVPVSLE